MPLALPAPLQTYFAANQNFDVESMLAPFAPDAIVRDERKTHQGTDAIRAWIEQATIANKAIATPTAIHTDGDRHTITATVAGAFKGSPITLTFRFRVEGERIAELEIG